MIVQETHEHLEDDAVSSPEEVFAVYVEGARQRTNVQVLRRRRRDEVVDIISRQRAEILRQTSGVSFLASFSEVFVISLFVHCPDQEIGDFAEMLTHLGDLRRLESMDWLQTADLLEVFDISLFVHNMPLIALIRRLWTFLRS